MHPGTKKYWEFNRAACKLVQKDCFERELRLRKGKRVEIDNCRNMRFVLDLE